MLEMDIFTGLRKTVDDNRRDFTEQLVTRLVSIFKKEREDFFYNYLIALRLLHNSEEVAYTDTDGIVWLNAPGKVGEDVLTWETIYCHECLHQLWNTFEVGDKIKKATGTVDYQVLNIASDCVINEYLIYRLRKKKPTTIGIILAEQIKEAFDVDYDINRDTQYTLYMKIMNSPKMKESNKWKKIIYKDGEGEGEAHPIPKHVPLPGHNKSSKDSKDDTENKKKPGGAKGGGGKSEIVTKDDIANIKDVLDSFSKHLSGSIRGFLDKCKSSSKLEGSDKVVRGKRGSNWYRELNREVSGFIQDQIDKVKKKTKSSYSRPNRRAGIIKKGQPILPGKMKDNSYIQISSAFFTDISGSMASCIDQVIDATYSLATEIDRDFHKSPYISDITSDFYVFNEDITKIKFGQRVEAEGGNISLGELVEIMDKNYGNYLISIIITDAGFSSGEAELIKYLKEHPDQFLVFISSEDNDDIKDILSKRSNAVFIRANANFGISK